VTAVSPCAASISNVNYLICESWNKDFSFDWYCDDESSYVAIFKSDLLPALLLGLWQAMVMPIALYWLALVRTYAPSALPFKTFYALIFLHRHKNAYT
jgi:hypothetical protein